jgi:transposase
MKWQKIKLSEKELKELKKVEKKVKKTQLLKRLQCIKLKDKGWTNIELANFFNVYRTTISVWVNTYAKKGLNTLLQWEYKGRVSSLNQSQKEELIIRNNKKPFDTAKEAKNYIEQKFNKKFHLHHVQKLLKKNFDFHTKKQE